MNCTLKPTIISPLQLYLSLSPRNPTGVPPPSAPVPVPAAAGTAHARATPQYLGPEVDPDSAVALIARGEEEKSRQSVSFLPSLLNVKEAHPGRRWHFVWQWTAAVATTAAAPSPS